MGRREDMMRKAEGLMDKPDKIRNIGIAAHIDHGKTTLSDNLLAGAGMMSEELAGNQLVLDFDEQEQARGITINAASISMVHDYSEDEFLINLIDTPGHVDFGGDVTRAMRAVDGCIIVVCAVEGKMPQTETVVRQALREKVKPVLFINKVDRLINELKVTPEAMQERFMKHIKEVNDLIQKMVPDEFRGEWKVKVDDGSVAFGSARENWAISVPYMKKFGISFKDIYDYCANDDQRGLAKKAPVHQVLLNMVIEHLPDAGVAQKYRIPHIWKGDLDSTLGKAMINCDPKGPTSFMVTKISMDQHAGEIASGRVYSGTLNKGDPVHVLGMPGDERLRQVGVFLGADRVQTEYVTAGNIAAVVGLKAAIAGSTVSSDKEAEPFERIVHVSDPVVTKAIEAKHMKDLPKLVDVLRKVAKADPSLEVTINQETGEHLLSGMGELHLEITEYRINNEYGVEITSSPPIVVYRESVSDLTPTKWEGKSPNKHNRFYVLVEPLTLDQTTAIREGAFGQGKIKGAKSKAQEFVAVGFTKEEGRGAYATAGQNIMLNMTKGIQYLHETRELLIEAFTEVMKGGPTAREPMMGLKVKLVDAKLHEDAIHRGPAQVIPAGRQAIYGAIVTAKPVLMEPMQRLFLQVPEDVLRGATREIEQRRGVVEEMGQEGDLYTIEAKLPVAAMFGFSGEIRSATQGRALWSTENAGFEPVPPGLGKDVIRSIRERKGLKPDPPTAENYRS